MRPERHPVAYFDTSVLVKRYVNEQGASRARALLRSRRFLSSAIAPVEVVSALQRRRVAGELSQSSFDAILVQLVKDRRYWSLVEVTSGVLQRAETVIHETGVRTLDAIHLASAVHVRATMALSDLHLSFITADSLQREAALRLGLDAQEVG